MAANRLMNTVIAIVIVCILAAAFLAAYIRSSAGSGHGEDESRAAHSCVVTA